MKKLLILLLALCLLLTACTPTGPIPPEEMPGRELVPQAVYDLTTMELETGLTVREQVCRAGGSLYFLADAPAATGEHTVAGTEEVLTYDVFESRLYRLDLNDGQMTLLAAYSSEISPDKDSYTAVSALFPGAEDTLWVMENTTHYIFDLPKNFDETAQNKWEYYQYRGDSTILRQLDAEGRELTALTLTNLQSSLNSALFWNGYLLCSQGTELLLLQPDGTAANAIPVPGWVTALLPMGEAVAVLTDHEEDGTPRLYTLQTDLTLHKTAILPTSVYTPCGLWENTLYYTDRGNLFARELSAESSTKLLDWQDHDINRSQISHLQVLEDGSLAALHQTAPGEMLSLLHLTPSAEGSLPEADLTLGLLYPEQDTMALLLSFHEKSSRRIRVLDYSEYEALGQNGTDRLRLDLASGLVPDLLYSSDWQSPITDLAPHQLEDLTPYLSDDAALQGQGLMTSVFEALRSSDGKLCTIASSFHLSTTISLPDQAPTSDGLAPVELYTTREMALMGHLSRRAGAYAQNGVDPELFEQGLTLSAAYPETIDWKAYEKKGVSPGWQRVRQGSQAYLSGTYSSFPDLAYDMSSVGEAAILSGWPDTPGGHALEVWESWGMSSTCRNKTLGWSFLRQLLLEENQTSRTLSGLPTNRMAFQRLGRAAMQSGSISRFPVGDEMVEVSTRLTEEQYEAILAAADAAETLSRSIPLTLSVAVYEAVSGYFTGQLTLEEAATAAGNCLAQK